MRRSNAPTRLPEWQRKPTNPNMPPRAVEAIARRRRQMLVHSYLYYHMDESVIDDATWTKWAQQLHALQQKFGRRIGFYDAAFADWNGSSGYHLPVDTGVITAARRVYDYHMDIRRILSL